MNTQVLGISVDSEPCLNAWAESLGGITFPLLSDFWPHGEVAKRYGVLREEGHSERAIFILDKKGVIRYIDIHDIDKQPENEVLFDFIGRMDPDVAGRYAAMKVQSQGPVELPHGGVVMYCTPWCPGCRKARNFFNEHNIPFREVDITSVPAAAEQVKKWANGNRTTPTFDIDGVILVDWNEAKLREVLRDQL